MLSASLIQLEYASKHWKSTFSYWILLGKVGSPGVVAVDGRFRSCRRDVHRRVLWREEVTLRPPCPLLPCVQPVEDSRRACIAVRRHCRSGGRLRLRALGGFPRFAQGRCGGH